MRRSDREVTSRAEIVRVIDACDCCRVGFADAGGVYIVPMNFAYMDNGALGALRAFFLRCLRPGRSGPFR